MARLVGNDNPAWWTVLVRLLYGLLAAPSQLDAQPVKARYRTTYAIFIYERGLEAIINVENSASLRFAHVLYVLSSMDREARNKSSLGKQYRLHENEECSPQVFAEQSKKV